MSSPLKRKVFKVVQKNIHICSTVLRSTKKYYPSKSIKNLNKFFVAYDIVHRLWLSCQGLFLGGNYEIYSAFIECINRVFHKLLFFKKLLRCLAKLTEFLILLEYSTLKRRIPPNYGTDMYISIAVLNIFLKHSVYV